MTSDEVKISIIVPVYNVQEYLADCLDSLISQSLDCIEIICINDCSTDSSLDILHKYEKKDKRIIVIDSHTNKGMSLSRNLGLRIAKGKYVFFLDSDDYVMENALQIMYDYMDKYNLDILSFDSKVLDECDDFKNMYIGKRKYTYTEIKKGHEVLRMQLEQMDYKSTVWQHIYRLNFLKENKLQFYKNIYHEDELFSFQAYMEARKVLIIPIELHVYRRRHGSITVDGTPLLKLEGLFVGYKEAVKFAIKNQTRENAKVIEIYLYMRKKMVISSYNNCSEKDREAFSNILSGYEKLLIDEVSEINNQYIRGSLTNNQLDQIQKNSDVYLYGAGKAAEEWIRLLNKYDIVISGIIVSDNMKHNVSLYGHRVLEISEIKRDLTDCIVIPAVSLQFIDEVVGMLKKEDINFLEE